jgi:hypothetical protein
MFVFGGVSAIRELVDSLKLLLGQQSISSPAAVAAAG